MRLTTVRKQLRFLSLDELRVRKGELETFIEGANDDRKDHTLKSGIRVRAQSRYVKARSELIRVNSHIKAIGHKNSSVGRY